jgi:hypothetical protein
MAKFILTPLTVTATLTPPGDAKGDAEKLVAPKNILTS